MGNDTISAAVEDVGVSYRGSPGLSVVDKDSFLSIEKKFSATNTLVCVGVLTLQSVKIVYFSSIPLFGVSSCIKNEFLEFVLFWSCRLRRVVRYTNYLIEIIPIL